MVKRKVFVSYHHKGDQSWFEQFCGQFCDTYEVFFDRSLDGRIRSDDSEYVNRKIREDFIVGSSVTIVLCGKETWKRKYVDWEIASTLYCKHALLGIGLPDNRPGMDAKISVPQRFFDNWESGYARWISWPNSPFALATGIEQAIQNSTNPAFIRNSQPRMSRNLS
jgi:hypothetical protein